MPAAQTTTSRGRRDPARRVLGWLWLGAAATLLLFPLRLWTKPVGRSMLAEPARTIVDRADPGMAARWTVLQRAAELIPPGRTVTFRAADRDVEMELYMLGRVVLRHARSLPASYYDQVQPAHLEEAEYMVVVEPAPETVPGFTVMEDLGSGVVLERAGGGR